MQALITQVVTYLVGSFGSRIFPTLLAYALSTAAGAGGSQLAQLQRYGREDLQHVLNLLGANLLVDGMVGPLTQAALKKSMTDFGISVANQATLTLALSIVLGFTAV